MTNLDNILKSRVAQMVKRLSTMWETWVQALGWEDLLEKSMATHSSILAYRIPMDRAWLATVHGVTKSWTRQSDFTFTFQEATVRTRHGTTDWFQNGKGVHQGYILSPCLFNSYAEYLEQNALDEA